MLPVSANCTAMSKIENAAMLSGSARSSANLQKVARIPNRRKLMANRDRTKLVDDRRRYQRVNLPLLGRFMRENKQEYPCQIINMSPGGIAVRAPIVGEMGERVVIYLDTLGRFEGNLVRTYEDGFALHLNASSYKREKIANQLTWLVNKNHLNLTEERQHSRIVPKKTSTKISMIDGSTLDCQIQDVSLGGGAVAVEPKPGVGQLVTLGLTPGRVVRHTEQGISIEFLEIQDPATLERQFG